MTKLEIQEKIKELDNLVEECQKREEHHSKNIFNLVFVTSSCFALFFIGVFLAINPNYSGLGTMLILLSGLIVIPIPFCIVDVVKSSKAPSDKKSFLAKKEKLEEELEKYDDQKSSVTSSELIVKALIDLKKLLDDNIITKEEFDEKKIEILKRM